jgi:hypothetical protein
MHAYACMEALKQHPNPHPHVVAPLVVHRATGVRGPAGRGHHMEDGPRTVMVGVMDGCSCCQGGSFLVHCRQLLVGLGLHR